MMRSVASAWSIRQLLSCLVLTPIVRCALIRGTSFFILKLYKNFESPRYAYNSSALPTQRLASISQSSDILFHSLLFTSAFSTSLLTVSLQFSVGLPLLHLQPSSVFHAPFVNLS